MSKGKLGKWVNDNIVMLVGVPLIIGIHYGWAKIQDVPYLVDPSEKRGQPIIEVSNNKYTKLVLIFNCLIYN